jgi:large subunit ribosomal protein L25
MGENVSLNAELRTEAGGQAKKIRKQGYLPAVIYGKDKESINIMIEMGAFEKAFVRAGESTLIELKIGEKQSVKTLIYDVQKDPVRGKVIHVDFYQVDMKQKITTEIPLNFIGESVAVEQHDGALVKNISEIEVECLPNDLVSSIDVDISSLVSFDDVIKVGNIKFPAGIEPTINTDEVVALVMEPTEEKESEVKTEAVTAEAVPEKTEAKG